MYLTNVELPPVTHHESLTPPKLSISIQQDKLIMFLGVTAMSNFYKFVNTLNVFLPHYRQSLQTSTDLKIIFWVPRPKSRITSTVKNSNLNTLLYKTYWFKICLSCTIHSNLKTELFSNTNLFPNQIYHPLLFQNISLLDLRCPFLAYLPIQTHI